jgi:hypothetical protein
LKIAIRAAFSASDIPGFSFTFSGWYERANTRLASVNGGPKYNLSRKSPYGDPLEREPERVLNDVENGIVSREEAKEIYGVVIERDDLVLDLAVTGKLRASLRQERLQETKWIIRYEQIWRLQI